MKGFLIGLALGIIGFLIWQAAAAVAIIRGTQSPDPGDFASVVSFVGFGLMLASPIYFWVTRPLMARRRKRDGD